MSILAQCPICRAKVKITKKRCKCGEDLDKAKRSSRVKYWVNYRLPNGKQKRVPAGFSIEDAKATEGKIKAQKVENPTILEKMDDKVTVKELVDWYLERPDVNRLRSHKRVVGSLGNFVTVYDRRRWSTMRLADIENYQEIRLEQGAARATIDQEITNVKTMVNRALDHKLVTVHTLEIFRGWKRLLKKGTNARSRIISAKEYIKLENTAPDHLKSIIGIAYRTGMRGGEILGMRWSHVDFEARVIRLPRELIKEGPHRSGPKVVPMSRPVEDILRSLPRFEGHDFVITYKGRPVTSRGGYKRSFGTACEKAGLKHGENVEGGLIFHDFRRTVKTNMVKAGIDPAYRDLILGHSLNGMDVHYLDLSEKDLVEAIDKFSDWLEAEVVSASVDQRVDQK